MPDALDPLPLLRALHERGIEHIVVGGFAVNAHGFIRVTKDLDIVPSPAEGNLEKLAEMLRDLNARILDIDDFTLRRCQPIHAHLDLEMGGNYCLLTDLGRLDVMQWLTGLEPTISTASSTQTPSREASTGYRCGSAASSTCAR